MFNSIIKSITIREVGSQAFSHIFLSFWRELEGASGAEVEKLKLCEGPLDF
jgi:hypothetical protein